MEKGSMTLIELGPGIPTAISGVLERSLVANFVSLNRGVFWLPTRKTSAEAAKNLMMGSLTKEQFEKNVRIPELAAQMELVGAPYVMPVEGSSPASDYKWKSISYALGNAESPMLSLMGFDSLESIYGDKVMDQIPDHLAADQAQQRHLRGDHLAHRPSPRNGWPIWRTCTSRWKGSAARWCCSARNRSPNAMRWQWRPGSGAETSRSRRLCEVERK